MRSESVQSHSGRLRLANPTAICVTDSVVRSVQCVLGSVAYGRTQHTF